MGWKISNSKVSTRVVWGFFCLFCFLAERPFQRWNFEEIPQKTSFDLSGLIWKVASNRIAYMHKTLVSPLTGFILGFVMCEDVKAYGCINDEQKCGLLYSRSFTGNFIPFLRLEGIFRAMVTNCPDRREESCSVPNQREGVKTLLISDHTHYLAFPFHSDTVV